MKVSAGIICLLALTGCSSVPICEKKSLRSEYEHVSHWTVGPPISPQSDEDWIDHISLIGRCRNDRAYVEIGAGYIINEGGFKGPDETFTGRVGYYLLGED
jgi:hypothetical protein